MINRIDLFMPPRSQYGVLHHFTKKFAEAFNRAGVNCRVMEAQHDNPRPFLEDIFKDPPDCTLSFNGLLPDVEGRFFCDLINIPHVACLVDSPNQFFLLVKSPYTIVTCPDRFACDFFRGMNCENVVFMPHACEKDLEAGDDKRIHDVVMLASCIDHEAIRQDWKEKYPKALCEALDHAAETTLSDQETSYVQAFVQALDHQIQFGLDPRKIDYFEILDELERYIRGKDRNELLLSIKDAKVDLFGAGKECWQKYIKNNKNITLHNPVNFDEALDVMRKSKIVLNSCAWIKNGAHERIFYGLGCKSLVITNENIYTRENFTDGKNIVFYQHGKWGEVNEKVNYYLANESERQKVVEQGHKIVMENHTWDVRANMLLKELEPILKRLKSQPKP